MANIIGTNGGDFLFGTNSKDVIVALDDGDDVLGNGGNDWIDGGAGRDHLWGGTGNDTIVGGLGIDTIYGGAGNDLIGLSDNSRNASPGVEPGDLIYGDAFNDFFDFTASNQQGDDIIYGTSEADGIYGDNGGDPNPNAGGHDTIFAGNGSDTVFGEGGNDSISGEGGNDSLSGGEGKDTLWGGDGSDTLTGGGGADVIDGGAGDDRIVYNAASDSVGSKIDTIIGFTSGFNSAFGDKIDITALGAPGSDLKWNGGFGPAVLEKSAWYQPVAGGVKLMADVNGDGAADFQVFVQGVSSLKHIDIVGVINNNLSLIGEVTNDGDPVIEAGSASAGDPTAGGVLDYGTDVEGDELVVANVGVQEGTYGSLLLTVDGWQYALDNSRLATDALGAGEIATDTFQLAITDGSAVSNFIPVVITISGTNDAAVITGDITGFTVEDQSGRLNSVREGAPATGDLDSVDVDDPMDAFQAVTGAVSDLGFGKYDITSSGEWTYRLDNTNVAVQALTTGDTPVDTFTVYAADGTAQVISVTVLGQNDAPQVVAQTLAAGFEDTHLVFSAANGNPIAVSDPENAVLTVTLSTFATTSLTLAGTDGLTFTAGDGTSDSLISFSGTVEDINSAMNGMSYLHSLNSAGPAILTVRVSDGSIEQSPLSIFITISPVNDPPSGFNSMWAISEDTSLTLGTGVFGFNDFVDLFGFGGSVANELAGVKITTLPGAGTLTNDGIEVTAGQIISASDLAAGHLVFTPAPNGNGTPYASFTFQAQDDGGTANGGIDLDPTPNTVTINVNPINDPPLTASYALDASFDGDGRVVTSFGSDSQAADLAVQADDKIVVAGVNLIEGVEHFALARYNQDGSLDGSFGGTGTVTTAFGMVHADALALAVQPDGKVIAVGNTRDGFETDFAIARYNADGSLDGTFDADGRVTTDFGGHGSAAYSVALQPGGKILVAGSSLGDFALARYNADGSLDVTFGAGGLVTADIATSDGALDMVLQPDGKILLVGYSGHDFTYDIALVRFNPDGTLDTTFDGDGVVVTDLGGDDFAHSVALQADGKIVIGGQSGDLGFLPFKLGLIGLIPGEFAVARYNADGSLDTTFDSDGIVTTAIGPGADAATGVALQDDGKIVAGGSSFNGTDYDFALVRYDAAGNIDTTFDADGHLTVSVGLYDDIGRAMKLDENDAIVMAGHSISDSGFAEDISLIRLSSQVLGAGDDDILVGSGANDLLIGGAGDDTMTGSSGDDEFRWNSGDQGSPGSPARDQVTDFVDGADALNLSDLLVGESVGSLDNYLDFGLVAGRTTVSVRTSGAGALDQLIVLNGVDLVTGTSGDSEIISNLLAAGRLITN